MILTWKRKENGRKNKNFNNNFGFLCKLLNGRILSKSIAEVPSVVYSWIPSQVRKSRKSFMFVEIFPEWLMIMKFSICFASAQSVKLSYFTVLRNLKKCAQRDVIFIRPQTEIRLLKIGSQANKSFEV